MTRFLPLDDGSAINIDIVARVRHFTRKSKYGDADIPFVGVYDREGERLGNAYSYEFEEAFLGTIVPAAAGAQVVELVWLEPEGDTPGEVMSHTYSVLAWNIVSREEVVPIVGETIRTTHQSSMILFPRPDGGWFAPEDAWWDSLDEAKASFEKRCRKEPETVEA